MRKVKVRRKRAKAKAKGEVTKAKEKVKVTLGHNKKVRGEREPTAKLLSTAKSVGHYGKTILAKATMTSVVGAAMQLARTGVHMSTKYLDHLTPSTSTRGINPGPMRPISFHLACLSMTSNDNLCILHTKLTAWCRGIRIRGCHRQGHHQPK